MILPLLVVFCLASVQAQEDALDYNRDAPYNTIVSHLGCLQQGNYHPEIAAKAFSQQDRTKKEASDLAVQLKKLLKEQSIDSDAQVPQDAHCIAPKAKYHKYQLTQVLPSVSLMKVDNQWLYSEETAQGLGAFAQATHSSYMKKLQDLLPSIANKSFIGLYLWQYFVLLLLILCIPCTYISMYFLSKKWSQQSSRHWAYSILFPTEKPAIVVIIIVASLFILALPTVQLPTIIELSTMVLLRGIWALAMTVLCYRSVNGLVPNIDRRKTVQTEPRNMQLMRLAKPFLKVLVVIAGILLILRSIGFDISPLLAAISISSLAFALASQDTIKNLFASLMICIDQPFGIGDTISTGAITGKVEEIGLRSTRIRTHQQSIIYVPNAKLTDTHIDNYGLKKYWRFDAHIAVAYDTSPALLESFIKGLNEIVIRYDYIRKDQCSSYLEGMQSATLKILFCVHLNVNSWDKELQCKHEILHAIIKLSERLDIPLASLT